MKKVIYLAILLFGFIQINAQEVSYNRTELESIKKLGTINMRSLPQNYNAGLEYLEAPAVSGPTYKKHLASIKEEVNKLFPKNDYMATQTRGLAGEPRVIHSFFGNNSSVGTPLDTHMAVSNDGQVISCINSHIAAMDKTGQTLWSSGLLAFSNELDLPDNLFDPRVLYDPVEDRFVLLCLAGNSSSGTAIMVAFSDSNDAGGDWHFYQLPGNPFMNTTWTDFPMVTITPNDVVITINLILDDVSWQLGFVETLIWQLDKNAGYAGETFNPVMWDDITYNGGSIRNLCPVESGDGNPDENIFFMSNRNFDMENDSFFIVELTGGHDNPDAEILVDVYQSDTPYGAPPNAIQPSGGALQTNDARVLDAFIYNDEIHFVGNTRNLTNNGAGIYHGIVRDVFGDREISLEHIIGDDFEVGYPGISLAGSPSTSEGAMISFDHASSSRFPGISAMYYDFSEGYSEIVEVVAGTNFIDMIGAVERWGDYAGNQRKYNDPELVWITGTVGFGNFNRNHPWVAALATPEGVLSVEDTNPGLEHKIYPNPLTNVFYIEFNIPEGSKHVQVDLFDMNGMKVDHLHHEKVLHSGKSRLGFDAQRLLPGSYVVKINIDNEIVKSEKIIVGE